ncbi:MAG: DUF4124 domain-containing protein [bacterium]
MYKKTALFLLAAIPVVGLAEFYKWVDQDGVVHYGEDPGRGEQVEMPGLSTYAAPKPPKTDKPAEAAAAPGEGSGPAAQPDSFAYTSINIRSPQMDESIFSNEGLVDVVVATEPPLQVGHKLKIYVDGALYGEPKTSNAFRLTGLNRGTHSLRAVLVDENGATRKQSGMIQFHMRQHSILNKAKPRPAPAN